MEENYGHKPVLLHECLGALAIKPDGIYVDGTLGRAGHSLEIVRRLTTGRLIALDRDETAIEAANRRLGDYLDKVTLVHSNFSALDAVLHELGVHGVDGMLFDLGVSSPQLDEAQRGFSYKQDAPLDMRMDESTYIADTYPDFKKRINASSLNTARSAMRPPSRREFASTASKSPSKRRLSSPISSVRPCPRARCAKSSTLPSAAFRPSALP